MFLSKIEFCVGVNVIFFLSSQVCMLCNSRTECGQHQIWNDGVCKCMNSPVMITPLIKEDCKAGYYGINCSIPCRYPNFGLDCQMKCHCPKEFCNARMGCVYDISTSVYYTTKRTQEKSPWTSSKEIVIGVLIFCGVLMVYIIYLLTVINKRKCKSNQRTLSSYSGSFTAI
ncbi:uncharacterized protein LOC125675349 [Ostrea edulis]|uniref:uncharacterized protein LOC125675349 n=1 Tax=Ostrea edulis TaxID=37623 RepID=UPI0024AFDBAC|nr:uncharacterized protein LOC125675349 [Ostrea edulis]